MRPIIPSNAELLLLSGYVLFGTCLNVIAYLIAVFYKKKFGESSPRQGFIIAIALAAVFIITVFTGRSSPAVLHVVSIISLLGSAAASGISVLSLYITMRKIRK